MISHVSTQPTSLDGEKILRALMLADRAVLLERRIPAEGREAIRAARRRDVETKRRKRNPVVPPTKTGGHSP